MISGKVILRDGTELEIYYGSVEYNGEWYYVECYDDQGYDNEWEVGEHTVTAEVLGVSCTVTVTVEENPIESVDIENVTLIEGIDSNIREDYYPGIGEWVTYSYYNYEYNVFGTVTLNDGSELVISNGRVQYDGQWYSVDYYDDQGYDNEWEVGEHTVTAVVFGVSCTFTVTVTESDVESVVLNDVTVVEGVDGILDYYYDPESGEYVEYMIYEYSDMISGTVTLKDGTELEIAYGEVEYNGEWYFVNCEDDQNNVIWGVGEHTVTVYILGETCTLTVTVVENNVPMISEVNVKIDMPVADELIPGNIEEPVYPEVSILPEESAELYEVVFIGMWLVSEDGETFRLVNENEKFTAGYAYAFTYDIVSARGVDENTALLINGTEYIEQKVTVSDVLEGETINEEVSVLYVVTLERDPDDVVPGDVDGDGNVTEDDAMYLLLHTFFSDDYPVNQECDFNGDGVVTEDDASYLLLHTFFADDYPLAIV